MPPVRLVGLALSALGLLAAIRPEWFAPLTGAAEPTADLFEAVERRVRAGMVLGLGLVLVAVPSLRPWSSSIPAALLWLLTGALAARLLGLVLDGAVPRQWMLVAVEAGLMTAAALWLWRSGAGAG